jgi:hypothetical protein
MPGARRTRGPVGNRKTPTGIMTTGTPQQPAFPAQWFERLLRALPGVSGLLATVIGGIITRKLDPSVEGSGPHGLTVREGALRQTRHRVHRIPHQRVVTIAICPS